MDETPKAQLDLAMPQPPMGLGFTPRIQTAFLLGLLLVLLTGLFRAILLTSNDPSEGLSDTAVWFGWIGASAVALSLVAAGYTGKDAGPGVRVALITIGLYLLLQASNSVANVLSAFGGFF